eukprot:scaffold12093_cov137-Isochrysis_galbana.AAC.15
MRRARAACAGAKKSRGERGPREARSAGHEPRARAGRPTLSSPQPLARFIFIFMGPREASPSSVQQAQQFLVDPSRAAACSVAAVAQPRASRRTTPRNAPSAEAPRRCRSAGRRSEATERVFAE